MSSTPRYRKSRCFVAVICALLAYFIFTLPCNHDDSIASPLTKLSEVSNYCLIEQIALPRNIDVNLTKRTTEESKCKIHLARPFLVFPRQNNILSALAHNFNFLILNSSDITTFATGNQQICRLLDIPPPAA